VSTRLIHGLLTFVFLITRQGATDLENQQKRGILICPTH